MAADPEPLHTCRTPVATPPPKLLDQMRARLRTEHYPIRTEDQYVHWIKRLILFHDKRHPRELEPRYIEAAIC